MSCGQRPGEREVAERIRSELEPLGFAVYIATTQQTLNDLKSNIFSELEKSDYFLFVDFKRDKISRLKSIHRGSLFTNQELGLASYLGLETIAFQETGVLSGDGILGFIQLNPIMFSDREKLPEKIRQEVLKRAWDPMSRNRLSITRNSSEFDVIAGDPLEDLRGERVRNKVIFHADVKNEHRSKPAINCTVLVHSAFNLDTGDEITLAETIDIKWAGLESPVSIISPTTRRQFDICYFWDNRYSAIQFSAAMNYGNAVSRFASSFSGLNKVRLVFVVRSENFPPAYQSFIVHWGNSQKEIIVSLDEQM